MPFTVVSFCTVGPYEKHMARLVASCAQFHINCQTKKIAPRGSWAKNCSYKPTFIREQLDLAGAPIVWLDADAELAAYPTAFDVLDQYEFALVKLQHQHRGPEILSGTIWMRNTKAVRSLLDDWAKECHANPEEWDQISLAKVLPDHRDLAIHFLAESYAGIVDPCHARDPKIEPIVKHHQASRTLKRRMKGVA